ncbi:MAG TPA: HIT family protein [Longimicrobiales bacterium]
MDEACIFCRIIGGEEMVSVVYEDDQAIAFLDIQPVNPGHTLVVSKQHYATIFDLPDELLSHCVRVAKRLAKGLKRAMGAEAINVFSANGKAGGQDVLHFHLHLIPIREGEPFLLQLPLEDAAIPMRSELDITAARIGRAIQEADI